jgi:hypothetical protein
VPYAYDPTPLIQGEIDASLDFTTNVPYTISQAGRGGNLLPALRFRLHDLQRHRRRDRGNVLATKRDLLVAWLRASRKGWDENFRSEPLAAEMGRYVVRGHGPDHRERDLLQQRPASR